MGALDRLREVARQPANVAAQWRARGGKVVGYRCLYVPEEMISAAGMLPYPLYGTPEPVERADAYLQSCVCELVRNLFDLALAGRLPELDGVVLCNTCDAVRRLYDVWNAYAGAAPAYWLNNPQKLGGEGNARYFLEELGRFQAHLEELSGERITPERLSEAIRLHDETRRLLREIYDLRRAADPPISALECLDVCLAASVLPRTEANPLLAQLLAELRGRTLPAADGPRMLVTGSLLDHDGLLGLVEEEGGVVVVEDLCTTTRTFWHRIETDRDPFEAIYRHLNRRVLCACMHPVGARIEHVLSLVEAFSVEAVLEFDLKYCHPFLYEAPLLARRLAARDIPVSSLEVGHDRSGYGQLRTRIQAFIEMVSF